jgi:hypothetical protein
MGNVFKIIVLLSLTLSSCADSSHQDTTTIESLPSDTTLQTDTAHPTMTMSETNSANSDTLIVDRQAAVFIEPDSLQIERRKKLVGEENFYIGADDYLFYLNIAGQFLDSVKLTTLNAKDKKYLKFVGSDNSQQLIRLDKLDELWSIYFFDPTKKAKQVDMTTIDEEYKSYFR